ncbi:hypothetical protein [uncultured Acetobacteroides sp.]|nr:hypothetical protein [uncultured Acetobacteroides sp.]
MAEKLWILLCRLYADDKTIIGLTTYQWRTKLFLLGLQKEREK